MRILLSVFACAPNRGSEWGIGWGWLEHLSRDHEVVALTDVRDREAIEEALPALGDRAIEVHYVEVPRDRGGRWRRWRHNRLWQRSALSAAQRLHARHPFDVVHHATYGSHRLPSALWKLDVPFLWGPVGGGEGVPVRFYAPRWMGWRAAATELVRELSNRWVRYDPQVRRTVRHARLWGATTDQTLHAFPRRFHDHAVVLPSAFVDRQVLDELAGNEPTPPGGGPFSVAFLGRMLGWKGLGLGLHAFARFTARHPDSELHLYGDGPGRGWLEREAARLGLTDHVTFHGRVPRDEAMAAYARHQALLFPSLHDSGGFVVIEAQAAGVPVVCLDTGGPGRLVAPQAGVKVPVTSPRQVVAALDAGLERLRDRDAWSEASAAGRRNTIAPGADVPTMEQLAATMYGQAGLPLDPEHAV